MIEKIYDMVGSYDVCDIANRFGITITEVHPSLLSELGMIIPKLRTVYVREDLSPNLFEYTVAHELGHFFLHGHLVNNELYFSGFKGKLEKEANDFAIALVAKHHSIPEKQVKFYLNDTFPFLKLA
ncbi:ImmA/IrrE family metallo-endopeptidase [Culicoidibacter larvae]|uniref:ImmA/IrrE family metallo-endopeptidase n=1 Tax=Culicoidibacter larvae TaxID=2579976 RepID=A0A5R8Q987_9FIRM|nr:ImmA/IrrE family metallo-endopeptidase [Culicoidibacter larvae]TLG71409.1 ImmA/IrrE family metallo-endopeptidase [Culicoidibacter larvae]